MQIDFVVSEFTPTIEEAVLSSGAHQQGDIEQLRQLGHTEERLAYREVDAPGR